MTRRQRIAEARAAEAERRYHAAPRGQRNRRMTILQIERLAALTAALPRDLQRTARANAAIRG